MIAPTTKSKLRRLRRLLGMHSPRHYRILTRSFLFRVHFIFFLSEKFKYVFILWILLIIIIICSLRLSVHTLWIRVQVMLQNFRRRRKKYRKSFAQKSSNIFFFLLHTHKTKTNDRNENVPLSVWPEFFFLFSFHVYASEVVICISIISTVSVRDRVQTTNHWFTPTHAQSPRAFNKHLECGWFVYNIF